MKKYEVKDGQEFNIVGEPVVTVHVVSERNPEVIKPNAFSGLFSDWKVTAVVALFTLIFSFGVHAAVTGDAWLFEKFLDAVVKVASKPPEGKYAKESD
jgi:hypothetical protein